LLRKLVSYAGELAFLFYQIRHRNTFSLILRIGHGFHQIRFRTIKSHRQFCKFIGACRVISFSFRGPPPTGFPTTPLVWVRWFRLITLLFC